MRFPTLAALFLLSFYSPFVLSRSVICVPGGRLPPIDDCKAVLRQLDVTWRQHGMNKNKIWGRYVETNETHVRVPVGFYLRNVGPSKQTNKCEFRVDIRQEAPRLTDEFNFQKLTLAASAVLVQCLPQGQNGFGYPSTEGNAYVTMAYRELGESSNGIEFGGINGTTLVMTEPLSFADVSPSATERT